MVAPLVSSLATAVKVESLSCCSFPAGVHTIAGQTNLNQAGSHLKCESVWRPINVLLSTSGLVHTHTHRPLWLILNMTLFTQLQTSFKMDLMNFVSQVALCFSLTAILELLKIFNAFFSNHSSTQCDYDVENWTHTHTHRYGLLCCRLGIAKIMC